MPGWRSRDWPSPPGDSASIPIVSDRHPAPSTPGVKGRVAQGPVSRPPPPSSNRIWGAWVGDRPGLPGPTTVRKPFTESDPHDANRRGEKKDFKPCCRGSWSSAIFSSFFRFRSSFLIFRSRSSGRAKDGQCGAMSDVPGCQIPPHNFPEGRQNKLNDYLSQRLEPFGGSHPLAGLEEKA